MVGGQVPAGLGSGGRSVDWRLEEDFPNLPDWSEEYATKRWNSRRPASISYSALLNRPALCLFRQPEYRTILTPIKFSDFDAWKLILRLLQR